MKPKDIRGKKKKVNMLVWLFVMFIFMAGVCGAEQKESRTVYLSQEELNKLNKGLSVYRWYGEGDKFMDEVRPPKIEQVGGTMNHIRVILEKYGMLPDNATLALTSIASIVSNEKKSCNRCNGEDVTCEFCEANAVWNACCDHIAKLIREKR